MVSQIGSIIGANFNQPADKLSETTKKRLEALGIDTSSIKTETQGRSILASVEKVNSKDGTEKVQGQGKNPEGENIKQRAKELAAQFNVSVSPRDGLKEILDKISTAIDGMKTESVGAPDKLQEAAKYQAAYDSIVGAASSMQQQQDASQGKLSGSLDGLALYNKIKLGLS